MDKKRNASIKASYPVWFIISFSVCGIATILLCMIYTAWVIYTGRLYSHLWKMLFMLVLMAASYWFLLKIVFYSITATDVGIETHNIVGSSKFFDWDEIVEIRNPTWGIPHDAIYVVSRNRSRIMLLKGMKNLEELINIIKLNSPNLKN